MSIWFSEKYLTNSAFAIQIKEYLFTGRSKYQKIDILDTEDFGKVFVLDGFIMLTEKDEFVYHEMLAHVPLFSHPLPENILIIGGGDGGTAREVLKHNEVKKITLVEIDEMVIEVCKKYLNSVSFQLNNPKLKIIIQDGAVFIKNTKEIFDVVLVDSTDPIGVGEVLISREFYQDIFMHISENGIFSAQTQSPFYEPSLVKKIYNNLKTVFPIVKMYLAFTPTYPSGMWSFAFCSKNIDGENNFRPSNIVTKYYNSSIHKSSFVLPNFLKE